MASSEEEQSSLKAENTFSYLVFEQLYQLTCSSFPNSRRWLNGNVQNLELPNVVKTFESMEIESDHNSKFGTSGV